RRSPVAPATAEDDRAFARSTARGGVVPRRGRPGAHAVRRRPRRRATALPVGRDHLDVSGGRTFDVRGVGGRDDRRPDGYLQTKVDDQDSDQVAVTEYRDVPVDANW